MDRELRDLERRAHTDVRAREALERARARAHIEPEFLFVEADLCQVPLDVLQAWTAQVHCLRGDAELRAVAGLRHLEQLDLILNDISDDALSELSGLQRLEALEVGVMAGVSGGPLLEAVGALTHLKTLRVAGSTPLPGGLLSGLSKLPALRSLTLANVSPLAAQHTASLARLRGLRSLTLHHCPLTDAGFQPLASHPTLEALTITSGALRAVSQVCKPPALRTLSLHGVHLHQSSALAPLRDTGLESLELRALTCPFDAEGLAPLLPETLRELRLRETPTDLPDLAEACPQLALLDARSTQLSVEALDRRLPLRVLRIDLLPGLAERLAQVETLERLDLEAYGVDVDAAAFSPLGALKRLSSVRVEGRLSADGARALAGLGLHQLNLDVPLNDDLLAALAGSGLRCLRLNDAYQAQAASPSTITALLNSLPQLEELHLDLRDDLGGWAAVRSLPCLRSLAIVGGYGQATLAEGLRQLAGHPTLERLQITDASLVQDDVSPIVEVLAETCASLPRLKSLVIPVGRLRLAAATRLRAARPGLRLSQTPWTTAGRGR